ncbi:hypothetical protein KKF84_14755 [Myxococcota bacterium]|nr:hypothetical protein [Myxococcota bacterium]
MSGLTDHSALIMGLREKSHLFEAHAFDGDFDTASLGFTGQTQRVSSVVLKEDTALELGAPGTPSVCSQLWTQRPGLVENRLFVREASSYVSPASLLHFAVLELPSDLTPPDFQVLSLATLTNVLPKLMIRSFPGRLWLRVHRDIYDHFSLLALGQTIRAAYAIKYPLIHNIDIYLAMGPDSLVPEFEPLAKATGAISQSNRRLQLESDGIITCSTLDCEVCDEKPTCDTLKEVVVFRRRSP